MTEAVAIERAASRAGAAPPGTRGLRILVVTNMYPNAANPQYGMFVAEQVEALRAAEPVELVDVLFVDGRRSRVNYLKAVGRLRARLAERDYDLVHAHHGLSGLVATTQGRLPVVVTYHGSDLCVSVWQRVVSQAVAGRADANIGVSRLTCTRLGPGAVHLPCGIDPDRFAPLPRESARQSFGVAEGSLAVLFPGPSWYRPKGYARFRQVVSALERRGHAVHELRLEGIERDRVPELMAATDVLVMTSTSEGSPVSLMEALAAGLPAVATPVGDVPAMLAGLERYRVAEFDPEAFAAAVEELALDEERAPSPRSRRFEQERVVAGLLEVYRDVLGGRVGRAEAA